MTNHLNESLRMSLFEPEESGLLITDISGIGAPDTDVNMTNYAISDGSHFTGTRAKSRQIILKVQPIDSVDKESIETCRQKTYRYFPVRHEITLTIETDNLLLEIKGYVSKNAPTIFSRNEEIQIDIHCPDPYFYLAGGTKSIVFSGIEPMFEFPFSNEKVTNDTMTVTRREYDDFGRVTREWIEVVEVPGSMNTLIMSEIKDSRSETIDYIGSADVGIVITMYAHGDVKNPIVYKQGDDRHVRIVTDQIQASTGVTFSSGDSIVISTIPGDRYVHLIRNGETINIINAFDIDSSWITLNSGPNIFTYSAEEGENNLEFKIEYRVAYQGV